MYHCMYIPDTLTPNSTPTPTPTVSLPGAIIAGHCRRFSSYHCCMSSRIPSALSTTVPGTRCDRKPNAVPPPPHRPPVASGVVAVLLSEARPFSQHAELLRFRRFLSGRCLAIYCRRLACQGRPMANVERQRSAEGIQTTDMAHWHAKWPEGFSCPVVQLLLVKKYGVLSYGKGFGSATWLLQQRLNSANIL